MRVLGLDPAAKTGWSVSGDIDKVGAFGVWSLTDKTDKHPGRRLERFRRFLYQLHREYKIEAIGVEDASFGSNNPNVAAMHNELRGVVKLFAAELELPITMVHPTTLKKWFTGSGRADKDRMIEEVNSRFQLNITDHNIADTGSCK